MPDLNSLLERADRAVSRVPLPTSGIEGLRHLRDRKRRNQRIRAGVVGIAFFVAAIWIVTSGVPADRTLTPGTSGPIGPAEPTATVPTVSPRITTAPYYTPDARSEVDFVIDLNTGEMTPLPEAIIGALGETEERFALERYAASSDGSMLAFVGAGEEGTPQIFIARIDGTGVRQVTHDPTRAMSPAWSPDDTLIAYMGHGSGDVPNVFVLDVATGGTTQITHEDGDGAWNPSFTPDGRSLIYTGESSQVPELRTIPVEGGESTFLVGPGEGILDAGNGAMSPDGSLVTFLGGGTPESGEVSHCGPCRLVANADGTGRRVIDGWMATPAGMWSPDSSRIVTMEIPEAYENPPLSPSFIVVTDVATEAATIVANGRAAIWLDNQTLLVAV
jgi:Tol biopolymer transport system component